MYECSYWLYFSWNVYLILFLYLYFSVQSSNDSLNTRMMDMNLNNGNSSQNDEPYVKIHPDFRRMDAHEDNLPTGVCLLFLTHIILIK